MAVDITTLGWGTVQDRYGNALSGVPFTVTQGATTVLSGVTDTNGQIVGSVAAGVYTLVVGGVTKTVDAASGAGGGGGAVSSVNGAVGVVVLAAADVGAQPADSDLTALAGIAPANDDLVQRKAGAWTNRTPAQVKTDLTLVKGDVGLGNVDNTSDASKPVSTAQAAADALALAKASNLSDLANAGTARTNLGLGSAATQASSAFEAAGAVAAAKGLPLALAGATAATRYVGGTTSGAPASGAFLLGDFVIDQTGKVYVCTTAGSPGTWTLSGGSGVASGVTFTPAGTIAATDVQAAIVEVASEAQPLDSDLTAIAALTTTTFGRSLLTAADAAAVKTALTVGGPVVSTYPAAGSFFTSSFIKTAATFSTEGLLVLYPIKLGIARTLTRLDARVFTAGGASSVVRAGLYSNLAGDLYPDALLFDTGDLAANGTGNVGAVASVALAADTVYWWGAVTQGRGGTVPVCTCAALDGTGPSLGDRQANSGSILSGTGAYALGYSAASITGALPGTFTSTRTFSTTAIMVAGKA